MTCKQKEAVEFPLTGVKAGNDDWEVDTVGDASLEEQGRKFHAI